MQPQVSLDFETRSAAELKRTGTFRYAEDASTDVLCLAFAFDEEEDVLLWHPAFPSAGIAEEGVEHLERLARYVRDGALMWAWNAMFERCVWEMVLRRRVPGMPPVPPGSWRCSAALAATYALPRKLEECSPALGLPVRKDASGKRLLAKLSKPRKPSKKDPRAGWNEDAADLTGLFSYCRQDVRTERAIKGQLRDWPAPELAMWQLDQTINLRGIQLDREMAHAALRLAKEARAVADDRIRRLTLGSVPGCTKRADLMTWLEQDRGVVLPNLQKQTLERLLGSDEEEEEDAAPDFSADERPVEDAKVEAKIELPPDVREVLRLWLSTNRSSTKKYLAMLERVCLDGRIRDTLRYHGASTGRWAGQGIQVHNFPRGSLGKLGKKTSKAAVVDAACRDVRERSRGDVEMIWGDVMDVLATTARSALVAAPGHDLVVADFAAIEARGTFWAAGDEPALEVMRKSDRGEGPDIYRVQAGEIYALDPTTIGKDSDQRQLGKKAVLGLGYQMGGPKFQFTCTQDRIDIPLAFACRVVKVYRESHLEVVALWKELEALAIEAVRRGPDAPPLWDSRHITAWAVRGRFLHCRLPSGRLLSYYRPWVTIEPFVWTDPETGEKKNMGMRDKLNFWGIDTYTKKWSPQKTYGGKLTENVVQALSRDLMAAAMPRCEDAGYPVILTVHDEVVSEVPRGFGSVKEFEGLVATTPAWADGLPVVAEGWRGPRYRK